MQALPAKRGLEIAWRALNGLGGPRIELGEYGLDGALMELRGSQRELGEPLTELGGSHGELGGSQMELGCPQRKLGGPHKVQSLPS